MKVTYDNTIFSLQKAGGISIYWYELIKQIVKINDVLFYEAKNNNIFRESIKIDVGKESVLPSQILRYLPFLKRLPPKSIFHSSYYRVSLQKDVVNITTVHDFTYEYYRHGLAKKIHIWQKYFSLKKSDGIICVSENTRKDLIKFIPSINVNKIKVINNGVSDEFYPINIVSNKLTIGLDEIENKKYIMFVGDRSKYKNFELVVSSLENLEEYYLVVVGGGGFTKYEINMLKDINPRVIHYLGIDGEKLNVLYNLAFCLVYPSSYEGFGIPVVEAMKAGCPVVTTRLSSIPEVAGKAAVFLNELTGNEVVRCVQKLSEKRIRDDVLTKGFKQASKFSWEKCFNETYEFYEDVIKNKFV